MSIFTATARSFLVCALTVTSGCASEPIFRESEAFLPGRLDRIDTVIEQSIEAGEIPGAVALIARNGEIAYHKAFGMADTAAGRPLTTDSIFRIASMTKAITSVAVMILYERGAFMLNDPISEYLPEYADMRVISKLDEHGNILETTPAKTPIRIVDLLSHSSGISYPFVAGPLQSVYVDAGIIDGLTASNTLLRDQMALLARQPLLFEPGSAFAYGLNTDLLGYLVEVVSKKPLDQFIAENITGPLGMSDTAFYLDEEQARRLVTLYAHAPDKGLQESDGSESEIKIDNPRYPVTGARTYFSGGAGLSSTARDYGRFIQMLLNGGALDGTRILSRKSVELMRTPRIDWDNDSQPDFGLGFSVIGSLGISGELGSTGAYSWGGAFYTSYWIDPSENLIAVFMSQVRPIDSDLGDKFNLLVYQALK